jgi:peroxiredoxin
MKKLLAAVALAVLALGHGLPAGAITATGDLAPDFTLTSLDGDTTYTLSDLQGQVVYIDFWASWCGPCRKSFPEVQALQSEYRDRPFQVLALSLDRKASDGLKFIRAQKSTLTALFDEGGAVASKYGVRSIPSMFIVAPDGKVAYSTVGFDPRALPTVKSTIEDLLKQAEGGASKGASAGQGTPSRVETERME